MLTQQSIVVIAILMLTSLDTANADPAIDGAKSSPALMESVHTGKDSNWAAPLSCRFLS